MGNSFGENSEKVEDIRSKFPHVQQLAAFSEDLRTIYFFTEKQIRNVFMKTKTHDINIFRQIVADVEMDYAKFPMDNLTINQYLYQTLMSVEELDEEKRKQNIIDNIASILDGEDVKIISYNYFCKPGDFTDENLEDYIEEYNKKYIKDFFVVHIEEDVSIDKNNKKDTSRINSKLVQRYIRLSRMQGINFFVFIQKDGTKKIVVGVQKGSMGATNDGYLGNLANKYNATKVTIPLSDFITS